MYFKIIFFSILILFISQTKAGDLKNFYSCQDAERVCLDDNERIIEGEVLKPECWRWQYKKTCNYPSKDDCKLYKKCYFLKQIKCLLHDDLGNCVNIQKEFSCKNWDAANILKNLNYENLIFEAGANFVCTGAPCIDGNCVDKSYNLNDELVSSISQLKALSEGKNDNYNFKLFEGKPRHCNKKAAGYINCCKMPDINVGWGKNIGAHCSKDEIYLMEQRAKNLCIYAGKDFHKNFGVKNLTKHYFCCFNNILEKIIQSQGRAQLGLNFGKAPNINCRGFTLEEIEKISWDIIDYSAAAQEIFGKIKNPSIKDIRSRIQSSIIKIESKKQNSESNIIRPLND